METLECKGREDDAMETGNAGYLECWRHRVLETWSSKDVGCRRVK